MPQVCCEFIRYWLERVLIQTKSRSMGPEWRRQGSRLTSRHTSPWTAARPVKVSAYEETAWVVSYENTSDFWQLLIKLMKNTKQGISKGLKLCSCGKLYEMYIKGTKND